jgi:hypothetical protein
MILLLQFVPLTYGALSVVSAVPAEYEWRSSQTCGAETTDPRNGNKKQTCCWTEEERGPYPKIGTTKVNYCQTCTHTPAGLDCSPKVAQGLLSTPEGLGDKYELTPTSPTFNENSNDNIDKTLRQQTTPLEQLPQSTNPQITQDENMEEERGLSNLEDNNNRLLADNEIIEQPENND